jgi:Rod binding domain-containing protein
VTASIPPIDQALMPAAVRNGDAQRKKEYAAAVSFERVLVGQMTEAMSKASGAFSDDDKSGDAATQQLKQTMPETLADALMASGGIGLATQLDQMWHQGKTSTSVSQTAAEATQSGGGQPVSGSSVA